MSASEFEISPAILAAISGRPMPPDEILDRSVVDFRPAPELASWVTRSYLDEDGPLYNAEHAHLAEAHIGLLWTNVANGRNQRAIVGQCEMPAMMGGSGGKWLRLMREYWMEQWFGSVPDFLITLDALYCAEAENEGFCALIDHELYHAAQALDMFDQPRFRKDGRPIYALRGHDVEEHVGVMRRWGVGAAAGRSQEFVDAANQAPEIAAGNIALACGNCLARAA